MSEEWSRADTQERKRLILEAFYVAWRRCPELRLGQLLVNSIPTDLEDADAIRHLFYIEDSDLVNQITKFANNTTNKEIK